MAKLDYAKYSKADVYWITFDTYDGERSLSQHGYVDEYPGEDRKGNLSLCGRFHGWDGGNDQNNAWEVANGEIMNNNCCKNCRRIFERLKFSKEEKS